MYKRTAFIVCALFLCSTLPANAQVLSNGTAIGVILQSKPTNGEIITTTTKGYKPASSPYDPQIFGVVTLNPALYLRNTTGKNDTPVVSSGQVVVQISSANGNITSGDFITSSTRPGVGEKATENGYVLGQAVQNYSSNNPKKIGLILVTLQPHYAQISNNLTHNIFTAFTYGFSDAAASPLGAIRYFVAGIITLLSFFFGFRFFARASNRGVEAIGRNPLARQAILASVFFNTVITIAIMLFGVAISYLILVL